MSNTSKRLNVLKRWEDICIICGEKIEHEACATFEHIIPRSMRGNDSFDNLAVSHWLCNKLRGPDSILSAVKMVQAKREFYGEKKFRAIIDSIHPDKRKKNRYYYANIESNTRIVEPKWCQESCG